MRRFNYIEAYRQGEVLIFKLARGEHIERYGLVHVENNVIREREHSGHEHEIKGDAQLSLFANKTEGVIGVITVGEGGATIEHPEHKEIKLKKGKYVVKVQKEAVGPNAHESVKD